jgi:hypothetical protein
LSVTVHHVQEEDMRYVVIALGSLYAMITFGAWVITWLHTHLVNQIIVALNGL